MSEQPVPKVTDADVERVVKRDYPASQFSAVMVALGEYGQGRGQNESARVRLAILKLAGGNLKSLRATVKTANEDYRDVLAYAEYPAYFQKISPSEVDTNRKQRVIDADWQQYREWLLRK
jgi:hypothetical protein